MTATRKQIEAERIKRQLKQTAAERYADRTAAALTRAMSITIRGMPFPVETSVGRRWSDV